MTIDITDESQSLRVGMRMLGRAQLKGLENPYVYEVVDGAEWSDRDVLKTDERKLETALESEYRRALEQGDLPTATPSQTFSR